MRLSPASRRASVTGVVEGVWRWTRRCTVLAAAAVLIGVPIVSWASFLVWFTLATFAITGHLRRWRPRDLAVGALLVVVAWTGLRALPRPAIQEGHQVFLLDGRTPGIEQALPETVRVALRHKFLSTWPRERWCAAEQWGCWRAVPPIREPFAFSPDRLFQPDVRYSRLVDDLDFDSLATLRGGFVNGGARDREPEPLLNWWTPGTDVQREVMPYVVLFELNERLIGSELCTQGQLWWERAAGRFEDISSWPLVCRVVTGGDVGRQVIAAHVGRWPMLRVQLRPRGWLAIGRAMQQWLGAIAATLLVAAAVAPDWRRFGTAVLVMGAAGLFALWNGVTPHYRFAIQQGTNDGLFHWAAAQVIVQHALQGDWSLALRGGESVFYFMPGMRYVRAMAMTVFGDTAFFDFVIVLLVPLAAFDLFRHFLSRRSSAALTAFFLLVSYSDYLYFGFAYAEPLGYLLGLLGLRYGLSAVVAHAPEDVPWRLLCAHLLLAGAVIVRPNLAVMAVTVSACLLACLLAGRRASPARSMLPRRGEPQDPPHAHAPAVLRGHVQMGTSLAAMAIGWSPTLSPALHNWWFGRTFVPFTSSAWIDFNVPASPWRWVQAIVDSNARARVLDHLSVTVRAPAGVMSQTLWELSPQHVAWGIAAIKIGSVLLCLVGLCQRRVSWLRRIWLGAACGALLPLLFFVSVGRYGLLAWLLAQTGALLVIADWMRRPPAGAHPVGRSRDRADIAGMR